MLWRTYNTIPGSFSPPFKRYHIPFRHHIARLAPLHTSICVANANLPPISSSKSPIIAAHMADIIETDDEDAAPIYNPPVGQTPKKERTSINISNLKTYTPIMLSRNYQQRGPAYPPWPLSKIPGPMAKEARKHDVFVQLKVDPLKEVHNRSLLYDFVTRMGKIKTRHATELTQRSQRRIGKAIRRARHMGIIPFMSKDRRRYLYIK